MQPSNGCDKAYPREGRSISTSLASTIVVHPAISESSALECVYGLPG
jgi:hypothetical protein